MTAKNMLEQSLRALVTEIVRDEVTRMREEAALPSAFLSTAEAAELARVDPKTIRRWIKAGRLEAFNAGRERRVRRSDLEQLLRAGRRRSAQDDLSDREIDAMVERDFR